MQLFRPICMGVFVLAAATAAPSMGLLFHRTSRTSVWWLLALSAALTVCWIVIWVPAAKRLEKGMRNREWNESELELVRRWMGWKPLVALGFLFLACAALSLIEDMPALRSFLGFFAVAFLVVAQTERSLKAKPLEGL